MPQPGCSHWHQKEVHNSPSSVVSDLFDDFDVVVKKQKKITPKVTESKPIKGQEDSSKGQRVMQKLVEEDMSHKKINPNSNTKTAEDKNGRLEG